MASVLYLLVLIVVFAGIGRLSMPQRERTELRTWTLRDVWFNVRRGVAVLGEPGPSYPASNTTAPTRLEQQD